MVLDDSDYASCGGGAPGGSQQELHSVGSEGRVPRGCRAPDPDSLPASPDCTYAGRCKTARRGGEPLAEPTVCRQQRGFSPGRSILEHVIELQKGCVSIACVLTITREASFCFANVVASFSHAWFLPSTHAYFPASLEHHRGTLHKLHHHELA